MSQDEGDFVDMSVQSFPSSGEESMVAEVIFGPMSADVNLLISISGEDGSLSVVLGNSPDDWQLLEVIPALLREVADLLTHAKF